MAFAGDATIGILAVALAAALLLPPLVSSNSDMDALGALRQSLSDPDGVLESWDPTLENPCTWYHVLCNDEDRVTRVDLAHNDLFGQLVPELGNIEFLQHLELYNNNIQGTIPAELGNLQNLISLDLYNNNLSGGIPRTLGTIRSLSILRLNDNHLTGHVPREILDNPNIRILNLSNNDLSGPISSIGRFEHFPLNNFEKKD